jgi:gamma-glutamyl-gamma-aminobutyrate hydrolase PuuD
MAAPTVGITVSIDRGVRLRSGVEYLYVQRSYSRAVRTAGACPIWIGPDASPGAVIRHCDAVVITGGDWLPGSFAAEAPPGAGAAPRNASPGTAP